MSDPDQSQGSQPMSGVGPGAPMPAQIGRYKVVRELGRGAMGVVYEAVDPKIGRKVALKVLHAVPGISESEAEEFRSRFYREARTAGMLSHPNIVVIHDVDSDEKLAITFMAMEYLRGETVYDLLRKGVRFTRQQAVDICIQVAEGLDHAHRQGVIHRDVKPGNLMLQEDGTLKITDFGIAKISTSNLTRTGQFLGTPNYMSPEQVIGHVIDGRSDLFSLGIIIYELLTGEKPFMGSSLTTITYQIVNVDPIEPSKIQPGIPKGFDLVVQKMLRKAPDERFQTGKEVAEALRALRDGGESTVVSGAPSSGAASSAAGEATVVGSQAPGTVPPGSMPGGTVAAAPAAAGSGRMLLLGGGVAAVALVAGFLAWKALSGPDAPPAEPAPPASASARGTETPAGGTVQPPAATAPTSTTTGEAPPAGDAPPTTPDPAATVPAGEPEAPAPPADEEPEPDPEPTREPARDPARATSRTSSVPPARATAPGVVESRPGAPLRINLPPSGSRQSPTAPAGGQQAAPGRTANVNVFVTHKLKKGGTVTVQIDKREVMRLEVGGSDKKFGRTQETGSFEVPDGRHVVTLCLTAPDIPDSPRCPYQEHIFVGNTTATIRAEHSNPPLAPAKWSFSVE